MLESFLNIATHPLLWVFFGLTVVFFGVQGLVGRSAEAPTAPDDRIRRLAEKVGMNGLHPVLFLILLLTWGIVAGTLFAGLYAILWQVIFHAPPERAEDVWNWRFTLAQLVALTTVLGAVIALPITINRLILTRRQTDTVEQGHITDRINKAVEGLGAEKTVRRDDSEWTEPNLEVRIGAIYALERISQDSERDHIQIMEILCAYIRQNSPASEARDWPELEMKEGEEDGPLEEDWEERLEAFRTAQNEVKKTLTCRTDIQTALTVIGRRSAEQRQIEAGPGRGEKGVFPFDIACPEPDLPEQKNDSERLAAYISDLQDWKQTLLCYPGYCLDLRNTNLQCADLSNLNLCGAKLHGARLHGAYLRNALLQGAELREAHLHGAQLGAASLQGAFLGRARLQGAHFGRARLQGADLWESHFQGARLSRAQMQQADLRGVQLQGALLAHAEMQGANLFRAGLQGANLSGAQLKAAYLCNSIFDGRTALSTARYLGVANLQGAATKEADFTHVPQFFEHFRDMFGDASVKLPSGYCPQHDRWLAHWPTYKLDHEQFFEEWRKWQADPETYVPPEAPEEG